VLSAAALFVHGPGVLITLQWLILLVPLMTIYTLGIFIYYARKRNPVGLFLTLISLAVLGFASYMALMIIIHGVALNTT
jgi:hypothetical protein